MRVAVGVAMLANLAIGLRSPVLRRAVAGSHRDSFYPVIGTGTRPVHGLRRLYATTGLSPGAAPHNATRPAIATLMDTSLTIA